MTLLQFIGVGLFFGLSVLLIAVGIRGIEKPDTDDTPQRSGVEFNYPLAKQVVYPLVTFILLLLFSGWLVLAVAGAAGAATIPKNAARKREQADYFTLTEALAAWIQQLRDAVVSGGGIETPLRQSAATGPEHLRPFLRVLAADLATHSTEDALYAFAGAVQHHIADELAAAYIIAAANATEDLPVLLDALSEHAQREVKTFRHVEVARRKIQGSSRTIIGVLLGLAGLLTIFGRELLSAYDTMQGQVALMFVCGMVLGAYLWIGALSVVKRPPRFFAVSVAFDEDEEVVA